MAAIDVLTGLPLDTTSASYPMPIRLQWDSNFGYCGEASLIAAGMSFGQYTSQFTARSLASPGLTQDDEESQLLLGINDQVATAKMKLAAAEYLPQSQRKSPLASGFLSWIKDNVQKGYRVIIGLYCQGLRDSEYDHIVPVFDATTETKQVTPGRTKNTSGLTFSDNYGNVFHGFYKGFIRTRSAANRRTSPRYSLPDGVINYGLAVTGVLDLDGDTIPVHLSASRNDEPVLSEGASKPPQPAALKLQATVSIPDESVAYRVYYYNDFAKVPSHAFNAGASNAIQSWTIEPHSGSSATFEINGLTSETVIFRAVPALAA